MRKASLVKANQAKKATLDELEKDVDEFVTVSRTSTFSLVLRVEGWCAGRVECCGALTPDDGLRQSAKAIQAKMHDEPDPEPEAMSS